MLLKSISYWAFPGGLEGTLDIPTFMRKAKQHRFEAVELCIGEGGELGLDTGEARCREILAEAGRAGVKVASCASGVYWSYALASESAEDRRRAEEALRKMARIAGWLEVRALLTIPGAVDVFFDPAAPVIPYDVVLERAREGLARVLPTAADCGVTLAIENVWNKFLLSPAEMATFIDGFGSPAVGAYVDVANMMPYGYPEQWLRILGKRVAGIHFKDFRVAVGTADGFVDLLEGDVNWPAVMDAIAAIGYEGPVVAEMIPLYRHYPEVRIANTSNAMDAILGR
ncbi:MAG TPA: sugar phosphate isomerase/epimerase family protein [Chthonomonadales bacterium]|nr:sugar phosphate isomerase/epimerase family protein [Chthonomonadales bacterium]